MRSAPRDDLTTRARIRDAALNAFAAGSAGRAGSPGSPGNPGNATVRAIAGAAGVSPALVLHHFGSKDGLREACDSYVLEMLTGEIERAAADSTPTTVIALIDRQPEFVLVGLYCRRVLTESRPFARELFAVLLRDTERYFEAMVVAGTVRPTGDPTGRALTMMALGLGSQLLAPLLRPELGLEQGLLAMAERLTLPTMQLLTDGLYTGPELLERYREHLATRGPADPEESPATPGAPIEGDRDE